MVLRGLKEKELSQPVGAVAACCPCDGLWCWRECERMVEVSASWAAERVAGGGDGDG